jgi:CopG family transcriptional regulator / antitoxin EndoAI
MERRAAYHRINITLPETALRIVDSIAPRGDRSRFIAEAIKHYAVETRRTKLRKRIKEGAIRHADRDRALVADWFALEEEVRPRKRK